MAKVRSFFLDEHDGVPDKAIATFVTECETDFYVNVSQQFIPFPSPRLCVIVTKLDRKEPNE